jgi:pimeloyl-ACP methyl ester carboxylesterase
VWTACQRSGVDRSTPDKPVYRKVDLECATVDVPRDHRQPASGTLGIQLVRKRAPGGGVKGALFLNPGGPGGSGTNDLADQVATQAGNASLLPYDFDPRVIADYDLVSFDPRGIGHSDPVFCSDNGSRDESLFNVPDFPVNPADEQKFNDAVAATTRTCVSHAGDWLRYVSTEDAARDLELLRQAVDPTRPLAYYGQSYGSYLGAVYADLFPQQVGAVAVDGVIDPSIWSTDAVRQAEDTAAGTERTLDGFASACAAAANACAYAHGQSASQVSTRLHATLRKLRDREAGASRQQEYQDVVTWLQDALRSAASFPTLASTLATVETAVDAGKPIGELPEGDPDPRNRPADYAVESPAQNTAVTCADSPLVLDPPQEPGKPVDWAAYGRRVDAASPDFGRSWLTEARWCESWPAPAHRYAGSFTAATANPLLAIGNTYDPATPLDGAQHLTRLFPNAQLVTLDGYGHTSTADPSACVRKALGDYLLDPGKRLQPGLVCKPDHGPFDPDLTNQSRHSVHPARR